MSVIQTRHQSKSAANSVSVSSDGDPAITLDFIAKKLQELTLAVDNLRDRNDLAKEEVLQKLGSNVTDLSSSISDLKKVIAKQDAEISEIKSQIARQDQYNRRNNIEIAGIPNTVDDKKLEKKVVDMMKSLNIEVTSCNDIEACHRLPNKKDNASPKRTIVRFTNREFCNILLSKRKTLKDKKFASIGLNRHRIYFNENLCPYYYRIWKWCRVLHQQKLITRYWTFNGIPHIKINEDGESLQLLAIDTLFNTFKDKFNFDDPSSLS